MRFLLITLFTFALLPLMGSGDDEVHITMDKNFKYQLDDNMDYAQQDFDDSGWQSSGMGTFPSDWKGIGWFRYTVMVPSQMQDMPISLMMRYAGGIELYIDGELVVQHGKVGSNKETEKAQVLSELRDNVVVFKSAKSETGKHTIAIRYSNFFRQDTKAFYGVLTRFHFQFGHMHSSAHFIEDHLVDWTVNQMFILGGMLFMGLGFIISAFFGRGSKAALFFGLFCITLGGFVYADFERYFNIGLDNFLFHMRLYGLAMMLSIVLFVRFIYALVDQEASKIFYGLCVAGLVIFGITFPSPLKLTWMNILLVLAVVEVIRVIISARSKGLPDGLGIVWGGLAFMVLVALVTVAVAMGFVGTLWSPDLPIAVYATMILAICFMIYEAKRIKAA